MENEPSQEKVRLRNSIIKLLASLVVTVPLLLFAVVSCRRDLASWSPPSVSHIGAKGVVVDNSRFGCSDKDEFEKLVGYVSQRDREAFDREYLRATGIGECVSLSEGDRVYVSDIAVGLVKLRKVGETNEYWTTVESIREE